MVERFVPSCTLPSAADANDRSTLGYIPGKRDTRGTIKASISRIKKRTRGRDWTISLSGW